jgi:V8-like Glu-specific endopeptidase
VLITNNRVLNKDDILPNKKIKFSRNDDDKQYEIEIDNSRNTYTNEDNDVTIIEIRENDKIEKKAFFEIDNEIFDENVIEKYTSDENNQIYLLHYPVEKMSISVGKIININKDNYIIQHLCDTRDGSLGGPLLNSNLQVIGIQKGDGEGNYNLGILLREPIEKFTEEKKKKEENKKEEGIKENENKNNEKNNENKGNNKLNNKN